MAGARAVRGERGSYTQAGYTQSTPEMYIADVPAGSLQDNLRDFNRPGYAPDRYRSDRPWRNTPKPVFERDASIWFSEATVTDGMSERAVGRRVRPAQQRQEDFSEKLERMVEEEKHEAIVCIILMIAIVIILAALGQRGFEGMRVQNAIANYQSQTQDLIVQNRQLEREISEAKEGGTIRNRAQNELGMLRPERASRESIYIRPKDVTVQTKQAPPMEPKMELLDMLLALLRVFRIGE